MRYKTLIAYCFLLFGVALAVVLLTGPARAGWTPDSGIFVQITQVMPTNDKGAKDDPGISKGALRLLKRKYGSKYHAFRLEGVDGRDTRLGERVTFNLVNGETIITQVASVIPADWLIDIKIQRGAEAQMITLNSGAHLLFVYPQADPKQPPMLVVLAVALLQNTR